MGSSINITAGVVVSNRLVCTGVSRALIHMLKSICHTRAVVLAIFIPIRRRWESIIGRRRHICDTAFDQGPKVIRERKRIIGREYCSSKFLEVDRDTI